MNNHSDMTINERPSALRSFFGSFGSGLLSGAVMIGIVAAISPLFGLPLIGMMPAVAMVLATGLFSGVMSSARAMFSAPGTADRSQPSYVPVPVQGMSAPALAPVVSLDRAEQPTTPNWVTKTGRDGQPTHNIQQILDNGSLSDKDRAHAILASREAAADTAQAR